MMQNCYEKVNQGTEGQSTGRTFVPQGFFDDPANKAAAFIAKRSCLKLSLV